MLHAETAIHSDMHRLPESCSASLVLCVQICTAPYLMPCTHTHTQVVSIQLAPAVIAFLCVRHVHGGTFDERGTQLAEKGRTGYVSPFYAQKPCQYHGSSGRVHDRKPMERNWAATQRSEHTLRVCVLCTTLPSHCSTSVSIPLSTSRLGSSDCTKTYKWCAGQSRVHCREDIAIRSMTNCLRDPNRQGIGHSLRPVFLVITQFDPPREDDTEGGMEARCSACLRETN